MRKMMSMLLGLAFVLPLAARAEEKAAAPAAPAARTEKQDFLAVYDEAAKKLTDLAGAIPAEKYAWRPGEGVRSVAEVYTHLANGNYFIPTFIGVQAPATVSRDLETETDKGKVIGALKSSIDHVRQIILATSDADLDKKVKLFGRDASEREVLSLLMNHMHEHLGQAIAYARMNGIVPPWSKND